MWPISVKNLKDKGYGCNKKPGSKKSKSLPEAFFCAKIYIFLDNYDLRKTQEEIDFSSQNILKFTKQNWTIKTKAAI